MLKLERFLFLGIIILFFNGLNLFAQTELSGLYFSSHEVIQDKRTSLNLTPHKPFRFSNNFSLEFDINFRRDDGYYGYIFRIIANGDENLDLISNVASDESNICLVYKDKILLNYKWSDLPSIDFDQWVRAKIDFDLKNDRITVSFNEKRKEIQSPGIRHMEYFQINFGRCKISGFYSTDVCPMSIKNISVYKGEHILFRQWTLGKHSRNRTFDNVVQAEALVENPNWLIDKYIKWRKLTEINVKNIHGITPDATNKGIFIADDDAVYFFSYKSLRIDTIPYTGGCPYLNGSNELRHDVIYNKYTDELWSYDFNNPKVSRFDLKTGTWSNDQPDVLPSNYAHHNRFISPLDHSLVTILGYGHYQYKSVVNVYDKEINEWRQIDRSDQIAPRYLSGIGYLKDNKALVFGGYGSKSGRQEISPQSYYDLYMFDLTDYSFTPVWTLPEPEKPFVSSETIVTDESGDCFYALLFDKNYHDSYLQLARFKISEPEMIMIGDSIPFKFHDTETWSYLFLNEEQSDLIAVVAYKNNVTMYAIAYPPLIIEDTLQVIPANNFLLILIGGFVFAGLLILLIVLIVKKRVKQKYKLLIDSSIPGSLPSAEQRKVSAVYLLGGFHVYSAEGDNITSLFSPTLKQLFLFLLFNSVEDRKGVSSVKLDEVLWHDKTGNSARNNRNVNISKLRTILVEHLHSVEITNKNALWQIEINEDFYCDYLEIINIIQKSKTNILTETDLYCLLGILHTGEFLPDVQADWVTAYKSDFTKKVHEMMNQMLSSPETYPDITVRYHIADCLLSTDPLNEEAIYIKCSLLSRTGKRGLAKIHFDSFVKAYEELMGSPYPRSFGEVVK